MKYPNLELIEERFFNKLNEMAETCIKRGRYEVYVFPQMWGSTALGFGGIGGSAMTMAYTTVINQVDTQTFGIFFDERLAYILDNPNELFFEDLKNFRIKSLDDYQEYIKEV